MHDLSCIYFFFVYTKCMLYEWDFNKYKTNFENHGIDFRDAGIVFSGPHIIFEDRRKNYGEKRWILYGLLDDAVVNIVYTVRKDCIRIISMRRANKRERIKYEEKIREN